MTSGGESHDADSFGIDLPFGGFRTCGAESASGVEEGNREVVFEGVLARDAVFHHDCGDPFCLQVLRNIQPLMSRCQNGVSAAGKDDKTLAVRLFWLEEPVLGDFNVREMTVVGSFTSLWRLRGTGSIAGPEIDPLVGEDGNYKAKKSQEDFHSRENTSLHTADDQKDLTSPR